ncbi:hypothetical protein [Methylobacterium haplocladii]|uniref:PepSY domain-containing protein n=1 Tax=Methylobacterium haplocladii TaxID=1176176 RepID=A0A512IRK1_9HYPH|nr:hypothetical protein [Methylobacterium haplocladii]GEP00332.1 hypothetical protein MHA02_27190 [Methylobacterium haplocladii]GLS61030.1 hypothetical protein GCM10007887_37230 [Methylobacterium haplocladii]
MRTPLALAVLLSLLAPAFADSGVDPHGLKPHEKGAVGEPLEPGSNSFTEAQVREKFGKMGFGEVTELKKDDRGIWHGKAVHAGKTLSIGMDFKGNVAAE